MAEHSKHLSRKAGLPPGSLVHIGKKRLVTPAISLINFSADFLEERNLDSITEATGYLEKDTVTWINVDGVHDVGLMNEIGELFNLHPLLLEDLLNTEHRPKTEILNNCLFVTLKMLGMDATSLNVVSEQISFVLTSKYLISFQEQRGDIFDPVRERIRTGKGKVRTKGNDYLLYTLIDAIVDNYYLVVENLSERIDSLEEHVEQEVNGHSLHTIQLFKRQLLTLKKSIYPLREAVSALERETEIITVDTSKYFRDVYDHTIHIIESVESHRDAISGLKDLYVSELSNRMNNIMKVLTVISTIFIPLTFITGLYGMNFDNIPELHWQYGYFSVWALMIMITLIMVAYFRWKKWF